MINWIKPRQKVHVHNQVSVNQ